jgi:hypothetical protein
MNPARFRALVLFATLPLLFLGCEDSDSGGGSGQWNEPAKATTTTRPATAGKPTATTQPAATATTRPAAAPATTQPAAAPATTRPAPTTTQSAAAAPVASGGAVGADAVSFGALRWTYGGRPNGSGARNGGVVISGARFSSNRISFTYNHDLGAWGYSRDALGGIACLFVRKENGQWVGGKFDWISSSRTSRGFENIRAGYNGWSLAGVPNPCAAAFVIVSPDGSRRSNVISGTWSR